MQLSIPIYLCIYFFLSFKTHTETIAALRATHATGATRGQLYIDVEFSGPVKIREVKLRVRSDVIIDPTRYYNLCLRLDGDKDSCSDSDPSLPTLGSEIILLPRIWLQMKNILYLIMK